MQLRHVCAVTLGLILLGSRLAAADAAFYGTWRFNPAKSHVAMTDMTLAQVGTNEWKETDSQHRSFTFKLDGRQYPDADGGTVSVKPLNATAWDVSNYLNGKLASVDHFSLSPDTKTLTVRTTITSGGKPVDQTITLHRTGSGTGFAGTWKGDAVQLTSFVLELAPYQGDGITFRIPDVAEVSGKFDGKDSPAGGGQMPPGSKASFTRTGPNSFAMAQKRPDGTTAMDVTVTVSNDGKTLTETGRIGATSRTWVFDREK